MSPLEEAAGDSCSPQRGRLNRHTPSQDSCCSNDTLFNLEELTCIPNEPEKENIIKSFEGTISQEKNIEDSEATLNIVNDNDSIEKQVNSGVNVEKINEASYVNILLPVENKTINNYDYITEFIEYERNFCVVPKQSVGEANTEFLQFLNKAEVPPLPSPEDKPWKQLPASLLNYNHVASMNENFHTTVNNLKNSVLYGPECESSNHNYVNLERKCFIDYDETKCADYVNENVKNVEYVNTGNEFEDEAENIYSVVNEDDIGVLGDIRFTGPGDCQLMSTSFSESNELGEEPGWDSGSDTRSSSSGEFIWKVRFSYSVVVLFVLIANFFIKLVR